MKEKINEKEINCKLQNREIRFEVTNLCNARCIMCPREKMTRPQGILDMGLYMRILDQASAMGVSIVSLENYGETFLDPFFFARAAYAKAKGMSVYTITNGSLFGRDLAHQAVHLLDKIRFSVYGATREIYESIHVGLKYDEVISNIEYLINYKKAKQAKIPKIEVYFLMVKENEHQIEDFKKKWLGKVDDIAIWKPHNWSDGRTYRDLKGRSDKKTCGRPRSGPIQVQWDGLVVPCCFDYNSNIVLGDLKKETLHDVVTGEPYNRLRDAHIRGDFSSYPFCDSCDQLLKSKDVLIFTTIEKAKVGAMNTTYDKVA